MTHAVRALPGRIPCIWAVGLNYRTHAAEVNLPLPPHPIFTMKSPTAALYPSAGALLTPGSEIALGTKIIIPKHLQDPPDADYEGELAIVIGETCRDVAESDVDSVIEGFTVAMDITSRRWQGAKGGKQWCYAKSFDTWCPLGPHVTKLPVADLALLRIETRVNGVRAQHDTFSSLIFDVPKLIAFLTRGLTLQKGTVILTGTPAGVGFARRPEPYYLRDADEIAVEIERIGCLTCSVQYAV